MPRKKALLVVAAIVGSLIGVFAWPEIEKHFGWGSPQPYSKASFDIWVAADPQRRSEFGDFTQFLERAGVGSVVPVWQLMRTDINRSRSCARPQFLIPPREDWGNIVPVLTLLRDHVVETVGEVEVQSSFRTVEFNTCVGGASKSRHLDFSAVDLIAVDAIPNRELFRRLCALQKRIGPRSQMGLGAYFDPQRPDVSNGRFHIDASGYRSWGYSKRSDSSACHSIL